MDILHTRFGRGLTRAASITALLLTTTQAPAWAQTSTIDANNPATCITPQHACTTVPITIQRTDPAPILAFSVTFSLSSNLVLCTPSLVANITEGNYLHQASPTTSFQVRDRGNGTYTADGVILGQANCVSAGATGTLFNVSVTNNGGSGTGTLTVTSVTLRDCNNAPLGSTLGSAAAVTIDLAPVMVSPISTPQNATENTPFSLTPSATISSCATGPATWSLAGSLPSGATFNASNGQIQWTPPCGSVGDYGPFTLTATAASGETGASNAFTIHVSHLAGTVTVAAITTPQNVTENSPLTITPSASTTSCAAGPFTWTVAPGLPFGATLNPGTGVIQWTPACGTAGNYGPFTLTATAATGEVGASNAFSIVVAHLVGSVTVAAIGTPQNVTENSLLTITPSASTTPCAGTLAWSVAPALPSGATLNPGTGEIQWTPACGTAGDHGPYTLTATASTGEVGASNPFTIHVVHLAGSVTVAAIADPQNVTENSPLTITPSATTTPCVGTITWSVAPALPSGATFNTGSGVIQWTPACGTAGDHGPYTLTATAATGEVGASNAFTIHVVHLAGSVTVAAITTPQVTAEGTLLTIAPSAGTTPCVGATLTWTVSPALPAGAALNPGTGVITWTPDCAAAEGGTSGTYGPFTLTATANTGEVGSGNAFSIHVNDTPLAVAQVTALAATPVPVTAVGPGTVGLTVTFTAPGGASAIEVYRAPFGNYPEYDNAPNAGSVPSSPSYPPTGPWTLTGVTASGQVDNPPGRDFWYYVAFAKNACGDVSPASTMTGGTLNYILGDVTNGITLGTGNNVVDTGDITALGSHYGLSGPALLPYDYLDVGPTTTNWVDGRPITDQRLDFEDLIMFAIDYHPLPAMKLKQHQTASELPADALLLTAPARVALGETPTAALALNGTGALCGLSTKLAWDPAIVEPTGFVTGDGLLAQGGLALSPAPGTVDAIALDSPTLTGSMTLATVAFRVLAAGDPKLRIASADGRDLANRKLTVNGNVQTTGSATPTTTQLAPVAPNPVQGRAAIAFSLAHPGEVDLAVYAVTGRRVATLAHGRMEAGDYARPWDGRDDAGHAVGTGVYFVHLATPHGSFTRTITYLR